MTTLENLFALGSAPGFERLHDTELAVIAPVVVERRFPPGATVCEAGTTLNRVYVVVEGSFVTGAGELIPGILGLGSVLFDTPVRETVHASATEGAVCLAISKPHMFTIVYQCPTFVCELMGVKDLST